MGILLLVFARYLSVCVTAVIAALGKCLTPLSRGKWGSRVQSAARSEIQPRNRSTQPTGTWKGSEWKEEVGGREKQILKSEDQAGAPGSKQRRGNMAGGAPCLTSTSILLGNCPENIGTFNFFCLNFIVSGIKLASLLYTHILQYTILWENMKILETCFVYFPLSIYLLYRDYCYLCIYVSFLGLL